jgi:hypothetical protein
MNDKTELLMKKSFWNQKNCLINPEIEIYDFEKTLINRIRKSSENCDFNSYLFILGESI